MKKPPGGGWGNMSMASLTLGEIQAGLNVFLDTGILAKHDGVETNVRVLPGEQRHANDTRPFLVVEILDGDMCLCVPLFSKDGEGRIKIDQRLKSGPGKGWISRDSYFSRFQFWRIPFTGLLDASRSEMNPIGNRQRYAFNNPPALALIAGHQNDSDTPFHRFE